jgi:hypothetical protein
MPAVTDFPPPPLTTTQNTQNLPEAVGAHGVRDGLAPGLAAVRGPTPGRPGTGRPLGYAQPGPDPLADVLRPHAGHGVAVDGHGALNTNGDSRCTGRPA